MPAYSKYVFAHNEPFPSSANCSHTPFFPKTSSSTHENGSSAYNTVSNPPENIPTKTTSPICLKEYHLTPRENEIILMLLQGLSVPEISKQLAISVDTVKFHNKNLYKKLNINKKAELFSKFGTDFPK